MRTKLTRPRLATAHVDGARVVRRTARIRQLLSALTLAALVVVDGVTGATPARANTDTDFATQLHGYGIYGQRELEWRQRLQNRRRPARRRLSVTPSLNALGRLAEPDEIAAVAAFLLSADASYNTGATVDATGRWI
jgi:NAD(P)-dependent dehydrogenase (short-subunit alcohol dehydrogenase family)